MRVLLTVFVSLIALTSAHGSSLTNTVIESGMSSGITISLASVSDDVMNEHMNKGNFGGTNRCEFRIVDYLNSGEPNAIWFASIFDVGNVPTGWSSFNAVTSSGKNIKVATYGDLSHTAGVRIALELTCL